MAADAARLAVAVDRADAPRDDYELGVRTGWYLFLQSAYGAWSPLTTVMAVVTLLAAWRLVGTATARLLPDSGD